MEGRGTSSKTLADLLPLAAERYGDKPAVSYKDGGSWVERSFNQVLEIARPLGLGLVGLGIEPWEARADLGKAVEVLLDQTVMPLLSGGWLSTSGVAEGTIERLKAARPALVISQ